MQEPDHRPHWGNSFGCVGYWRRKLKLNKSRVMYQHAGGGWTDLRS